MKWQVKMTVVESPTPMSASHRAAFQFMILEAAKKLKANPDLIPNKVNEVDKDNFNESVSIETVGKPK